MNDEILIFWCINIIHFSFKLLLFFVIDNDDKLKLHSLDFCVNFKEDSVMLNQ